MHIAESYSEKTLKDAEKQEKEKSVRLQCSKFSQKRNADR